MNFIRQPISTEDFISNVRFQLDNVDGYQQMHRDGLDPANSGARIKANCLLDAAAALVAHFQSRDTETTHGKVEKVREGAESYASGAQDNKVSGDSETH